MKCDPEGYEGELESNYKEFKGFVDVFMAESARNPYSVDADPSLGEKLGRLALFLAHVTPFYRKQLAQFPRQLGDFLRSYYQNLPSKLRHSVTQALILLMNRKIIGLEEMLPLFLEFQTLCDKELRELASSHVVQSIRKMNLKHRNEEKNRPLRNVLFSMLEQEDESKAKRALVTLCKLYNTKVWFVASVGNAICMACHHRSSGVKKAALKYLLGNENIEYDSDDDASSSDEREAKITSQVVINREAAYKAHHKGTNSSKKKKQAKLKRAIRNMKRQQRSSSESSNPSYYSPLNHLIDAQKFADNLFSSIRTCGEGFKVKLMMIKVVSRTVGLHRLILLGFYPFIQNYAKPCQAEITEILAATVESCHDMVPPDAVEPLFKQIVNQFVHDRSRPDSIAVGLNTIREICIRMPLLMTEDLLQDLALYKKSHGKAVSAAARSLIILFREVCPSLLVKKDRGRLVDPKARPKEYGEVQVLSNIPGIELLQDISDDENDAEERLSDVDVGQDDGSGLNASGDLEDEEAVYYDGSEDEDGQESDDDDANRFEGDSDTGVSMDGEDLEEMDDEDESEIDSAEDEDESEIDSADDEDVDGGEDGEEVMGSSGEKEKSKERKRKAREFDESILSAETSLRALKRVTVANKQRQSDETDGILSNEDFQRIRELKVKKDAKLALARQGFKIPDAEQLSSKRVNPATLEAHIKHKLTKEQRLELVRAGRESSGKYRARTAIKQRKTGGMSNKQKEHKKSMPMAAKRSKVAKSKREKMGKRNRSGKQFGGRKAWK